jgi:hypothetical protein
MKKFLLPSAMLLAFAAHTMSAASICPAPYAGSVGAEGVSGTYTADLQVTGTYATGTVQNDTGCNVLITFGAGGTVTTTFPNAASSYDSGGDDNLIGILNNSGATITSITLTSSTDDIFAFDGDGICGDVNGAQTTTVPGYTFVGGGNPCVNSTDPSGYGGPYTLAAATNVSDMTGTISFGNGGLGNGGSSFFSLEGPVDLNLQVGPGTPEPATFSLMGIAMCGLLLVRRIRKV